jgi:hypothetical protein
LGKAVIDVTTACEAKRADDRNGSDVLFAFFSGARGAASPPGG